MANLFNYKKKLIKKNWLKTKWNKFKNIISQKKIEILKWKKKEKYARLLDTYKL